MNVALLECQERKAKGSGWKRDETGSAIQCMRKEKSRDWWEGTAKGEDGPAGKERGGAESTSEEDGWEKCRKANKGEREGGIRDRRREREEGFVRIHGTQMEACWTIGRETTHTSDVGNLSASATIACKFLNISRSVSSGLFSSSKTSNQSTTHISISCHPSHL